MKYFKYLAVILLLAQLQACGVALRFFQAFVAEETGLAVLGDLSIVRSAGRFVLGSRTIFKSRIRNLRKYTVRGKSVIRYPNPKGKGFINLFGLTNEGYLRDLKTGEVYNIKLEEVGIVNTRANQINLRSTPELKGNSNVIAKLKDCDLVKIVRQEGDWYLVECKETFQGWAHRTLVQKLKDEVKDALKDQLKDYLTNYFEDTVNYNNPYVGYQTENFNENYSPINNSGIVAPKVSGIIASSNGITEPRMGDGTSSFLNQNNSKLYYTQNNGILYYYTEFQLIEGIYNGTVFRNSMVSMSPNLNPTYYAFDIQELKYHFEVKYAEDANQNTIYTIHYLSGAYQLYYRQIIEGLRTQRIDPHTWITRGYDGAKSEIQNFGEFKRFVPRYNGQ